MFGSAKIFGPRSVQKLRIGRESNVLGLRDPRSETP
jgi:hypothetical protein